MRVASVSVPEATAALMSDSTSWRVLETLAVAQLRIQVVATGRMTVPAIEKDLLGKGS